MGNRKLLLGGSSILSAIVPDGKPRLQQDFKIDFQPLYGNGREIEKKRSTCQRTTEKRHQHNTNDRTTKEDKLQGFYRLKYFIECTKTMYSTFTVLTKCAQ